MSNFFFKRATALIVGCSRAARLKIAISCAPNSQRFCVIFVVQWALDLRTQFVPEGWS
jgi:hypothetical protein